MTQAAQEGEFERKVPDSPFPFQIAPPSAVRRRRTLLFMLTAVIAYLLTLVATLPARLLLVRTGTPEIWLASSGTVWRGEAALSHGHSVRWAWAPLASLANLAFTTKFEVDGLGTNLTGIAAWRPGGLVLTELRGTASATLLSAMAPNLPFLCELPMQVDVERIAFGGPRPGAEGRIRTTSGACAPRGTAAIAVPVPPLVAEAIASVGGSSGWVAPRMNRSAKLISFTVMPNGATSFDVSAAGAAIFPGASTSRFLPGR